MTLPSLTRSFGKYLVVAAMGFGGLTVDARTPESTRGELLYTMHCIACHNAQIHWRSNRLANDWESLKVQVRLWQGNAGLQWDEADVVEVAEYLNATIYRYPRAVEPVGLRLSGPSQGRTFKR